ncbi:hypothetical protein ACFSMW_08575 [Virgibacillus halophilus]
MHQKTGLLRRGELIFSTSLNLDGEAILPYHEVIRASDDGHS